MGKEAPSNNNESFNNYMTSKPYLYDIKNSKLLNSLDNNDEDDDDDEDYTAVSDEAKDLYKEYTGAGLCQTPSFPETSEIGFQNDTQNLKDTKLEDYNNVGKFELSLND